MTWLNSVVAISHNVIKNKLKYKCSSRCYNLYSILFTNFFWLAGSNSKIPYSWTESTTVSFILNQTQEMKNNIVIYFSFFLNSRNGTKLHKASHATNVDFCYWQNRLIFNGVYATLTYLTNQPLTKSPLLDFHWVTNSLHCFMFLCWWRALLTF